MAGIEQLARENIGQVTSERRVKCVKHIVRKVEKRYRETDFVVLSYGEEKHRRAKSPLSLTGMVTLVIR